MESIADRLRMAREAAGFKTAKAAAESIGVPYVTYSSHETGGRGVPRERALQYARRFKVSVDWLLTGREGRATPLIPLKRYVGAGQTIYAVDDGDHEYVEAPPGLDGEALAAVIRGDSMYPRYDDGNIIMWTRHLPPGDLLNREAVVGLADGRILIKIITRGSAPGLWTLTSFNAAPISDQVVEWAAPIDWVKRR